MAMLGTLPKSCGPCHCESPSLDSKGTIFLDNDGTYRVRYCQRCGGGYDSVRDAEPIPQHVPVHAWLCQECGAENLTRLNRCTNCCRDLARDDAWICRQCATWNPKSRVSCVRCNDRKPGLLYV